jgi:alkylation response protein AidB-like acyl-CoA dehydrogenase
MAISNPGTLEATRGEGASLVDIARGLAPLIREHAEALEEGHIPTPLVAALYDAGVFKAMLPSKVGGLEVDPGRSGGNAA